MKHNWKFIRSKTFRNEFNSPKDGNHSFLDEYRRAESIGKNEGDCMAAFSQCPVSIFNFIPDVYTKDDQVISTYTKDDQVISKI